MILKYKQGYDPYTRPNAEETRDEDEDEWQDQPTFHWQDEETLIDDLLGGPSYVLPFFAPFFLHLTATRPHTAYPKNQQQKPSSPPSPPPSLPKDRS